MAFGRVLLVESDRHMRVLLYDLLTEAGFLVTSMTPAGVSADMLGRRTADAAVLGAAPGENYCARLLSGLNGMPEIPLAVMLSEEDGAQRLSYLELGADEVFIKPFDAGEVVLKLRSILRRDRSASLRSEASPLCSSACGLSVDMYSYTVCANGTYISMPPKEIEILYLLMSNPDRVFRRGEIAAHVWGQNLANDRTVDSHITRMKRLIGKPCSEHIKTVRGVGYKFTMPSGERRGTALAGV